jgi:RNA polymerase sigma factor (sigma-70 family)
MTAMTLDAPTMLVMVPEAKTPARAITMPPHNPAQALSTSERETLRKETTAKTGTQAQAKPRPADVELISAICNGQERALEILYERYCRYAYSLAYHVLRDSTAAEDVVQNTFLSIWRKAASYQAQYGSVLSWLQAIVHHRAIDKLRASTHRDGQWMPLQTENEQDPASVQPDVWEQAWSGEQRRMIRTILDQLPTEQHLVIELAYYSGYTHTEIAEQLNIPLGTVKGRIRLGLQKMKTLLAQQGLDSMC